MTIVNTQIDHPKKISGLVKEQFPDFYKEEGPVFIDFVKAYYDWMEDRSWRRNKLINPTRETVNVVHGYVNVVGNGTSFDTTFANGDRIAISRSNTDYEIFTIDVITNSTFLTITSDKVPEFAVTNATYGNVFSNTNPGYYTRRMAETMDIDKTADEFVVYFKEQFLKNIQFSTITDTRTMIKNSLDLYRSKGTPRSVDLLFKTAFGVPAEVYYPSVDLFRTSAADWTIPRYLELSLSPVNRSFVNKQITGLTSGATAFCDEIVRREINGRFLDVAYISAIFGEWQTGEKVIDSLGTLNKEEAPTVIGSLNKITISTGGSGYSIGNTINVISNTGHSAVARVANIATQTGTINVALTEGGYGYSVESNVYISDKIIKIEGVTTNTGTPTYLEEFEYIEQPTANISYSAASGTFNNGDDVYTYHANGDLDGTGAIIALTAINSSSGEMKIKILSGEMDDTFIGTSSNTVNATIDAYVNTSSIAQVLGEYNNVALQVYSVSGTFTNNEVITSTSSGNGLMSLFTNTSGPNSTIIASNCTFTFAPGDTLTGADSGATATIAKVDIEVGVVGVSNDYTIDANNLITSNTRIVNGEVTFISAGSGLTLNVANNFLYTEYANLCTTLLTTNTTHYLPIPLASSSFALPGDPACNLTSNTIANALEYANLEIGKIQTLTGISPGTGYNRVPIVKIIDFATYGLHILDTKYITIANATGGFTVGEVVTQEDQEFRGLVESANSTELVVQRMRVNDANDVVITTNSTTTIVGSDSGSIANVTSISTNSFSDEIGNDAEIGLATATSNGVITEIEIKNSGFGFRDGQAVTLGSGGVTGIANVYTYGTGAGFYRSKDGFLSDTKILQDGMYWQTHSYEVRASVAIDKYAKMLKEVVHVAGTQYFGNLVLTSTSNITLNAIANSVTGTNTVIATAITSNSIQDRFGGFVVDYQGNNITTRV